MTDRNELTQLQDKARKAGRTVTFYYDDENRIDSVFYLDPKAIGKSQAGLILPLITFAELERAKQPKRTP